MSEQEPHFNVTVNGENYELPRSKTSLYRHLGASALDHMFLVHSEDDKFISGTRFFREIFQEDDFETASNYMLKNGFEAHLNIHEPADDDMEAYIAFSNRGEDTPDWLPKV